MGYEDPATQDKPDLSLKNSLGSQLQTLGRRIEPSSSFQIHLLLVFQEL